MPASAQLQELGAQLGRVPLVQAVNDTVQARMQQFRDLQRSGATEMTGRMRRLETGELSGRFGGGMKEMFPELRNVPESPSRIADAIEKDKDNPLYLRVQKQISESIDPTEILNQMQAGQELAFPFGEGALRRPSSLMQRVLPKRP